MGRLSRYFEDVEIINGLKIEYVEDISGKHLRPPDIFMNYRVKDKEDILMKNIKGYGIYKIENPDEGVISSKFMVLRIRYRRLVRVVLNIESSEGLIIHSEVIDRFKGHTLTKELKPIDYYIPTKDEVKIRFDKSKIIVIKYNYINDEIKKIDSKLEQINKEIKRYTNESNIPLNKVINLNDERELRVE